MEKLKVFISSKMAELRDVREVVGAALKERGIEAFVYEEKAGARPDTVVETSLEEVEKADAYIGLFWQKYGPVTVEEFRHARAHRKPCLIYIRDKDIQREKALEDFLEDEVYDLHRGVTYDYFDSAVELGEQVADDIMAWLVRRHREMTAEIQEARVSQDEIARLQAEVDRLQAASRESLPQGTPADYLAQQMRAWFETLGYRFESHDIRAEGYFEWIINIPARRGYDHILVHGIEGEAKMSDVATLRQAVDEQDTDEGWLVAARRKSQAACDEVEKKENRDLFCYTFDELLDEHADFSGYLDWLEAEVKRQGIDTMYVPLACSKEEFDPVTKERIGASRYDERNGWMDGYIDRWLDDPSKEHISILGEFGTGKTWFALHYAWTALQRYREAKERGVERPRLPIVIPLRDYAKAVSVESLFSEFFFRKHEIPLPGYSAFEQLNRMGKLLLIFDGFDEMAAKVDRQKMINNFWELARVVVPGAKAILTCRTEHFPEAKEGRALLSAELKASTAKLTGEPPQFEVLELEKFDDDQIRQVLSFRAGPATVEQVMDSPELLDLARRPVMTEFILEALPDIEAGKPVDLSRIYLYAVQRKMERDIKAERTFTSLADKLYFLCELSWEMLSTDRMSLNYRLFPDRLRRLFGHAVQEQKDLDHWHYDMMGQTMLIRNADGDYTPAHRSLLEFFVAYKFAAELGVLAPDFTELARAQSYLDESATPQDYTWSSYFQREVDEEGAVKQIPPLQSLVTEEMERLTETVGQAPLTEAILDLVDNMLGPDEEEVKEQLLTVIEGTHGKTTEEVRMTGGNAATLLVHRDPLALKGRDLSTANLSHADFGNGDLTGCNLQYANLQRAHFWGTTLTNADLRDADLTDAEFEDFHLSRALAFSPDGIKLASSANWTVNVWDVLEGIQLASYRGHKHNVWAISWSKNSQVIGSAGVDGQLMIWKLGTDLPVATLRNHNAQVWRIRFDPVRSNALTFGDDKRLIVWNTETWKTRRCMEYGYSGEMQYIQDGSYVAVSYGRDTTTGARDTDEHTVELREANTFEIVRTFKVIGAHEYILSMDFRAGANHLATGHYSGRVVIWDWKSGKLVAELDGQDAIEMDREGQFKRRRIMAVRYSPDGRLLVTGGDNNIIKIWDAESLVELYKNTDHNQTVVDIDFHRDSLAFASVSTDTTIKFWDARPFVAPSGEPHINMVEYTPPDPSTISDDSATWPEWWQKCKIEAPEGMVPNPNFGKCLRTIEQKMNCQGLQLARAKGLDTSVGEETMFDPDTGEEEVVQEAVPLGEWLAERGAVLE